MQRGFAQVLVIIVIVLAAGIGGYFLYQNSLPKYSPPEQKTCTLEAKICPDGSSVGRTGPNCEFAPCPSQESTSSAARPVPNSTGDMTNWKTYSSNKYSFKYPSNWSLVELSNGDIDIYDQPNVTQPQLHDGTWVTISSSDKWDWPQIDNPVGTSFQFAEGVLRKKVLDTQLNGRKAVKIIQSVSQSPTNARPTIFIISRQGETFTVISFSSISQEQLDKDINTYSQILSTFKFTQ